MSQMTEGKTSSWCCWPSFLTPLLKDVVTKFIDMPIYNVGTGDKIVDVIDKIFR